MTVDEIFAKVKAAFEWHSDIEQWKSPEYWATWQEMDAERGDVKRGDCDDFSAMCVHLLRSSGLPARYVICMTETNECHCVADSDGLILDNRQATVKRREFLPYRWLMASGLKAGEEWREIEE